MEIICWEQTSTSQFSITIHSHHCMACTLAEADHNPVGSSKRDKLWAFTTGRSTPALNHICRGMISVLTVSLKPAGLCWNTVAQNNHQRHTLLLFFFFFFSFHLIFFYFWQISCIPGVACQQLIIANYSTVTPLHVIMWNTSHAEQNILVTVKRREAN